MKVSILGAAGSVGAPVAFYLAVSGLAEEIVMIDVRSNMAKQHAMDIEHGCLGTRCACQGRRV